MVRCEKCGTDYKSSCHICYPDSTEGKTQKTERKNGQIDAMVGEKIADGLAELAMFNKIVMQIRELRFDGARDCSGEEAQSKIILHLYDSNFTA